MRIAVFFPVSCDFLYVPKIFHLQAAMNLTSKTTGLILGDVYNLKGRHGSQGFAILKLRLTVCVKAESFDSLMKYSQALTTSPHIFYA